MGYFSPRDGFLTVVDGKVVPESEAATLLSDEDGGQAARDTGRRTRRRAPGLLGRSLLVGAIAIAIVIAIVVGARWWQRGGGRSAGPLAYVSSVAPGPYATQPKVEVARARLMQATGSDWHLRAFGTADFDNGRIYGMQPLAGARAALSQRLVLPDTADVGAVAVWTNTLDKSSVAEHGALAMIQFTSPSATSRFLVDHAPVFVDRATQARTDTYWIGDLAVYYSPAGGRTDETRGLREFLKLFASCPGQRGYCRLDPAIAGFDRWAPRAQA